ncbi:MAG: zinc dependent phospholipase C family protein [Bacilli bacterium]
MASALIHMCVAKEINKKLQMNEKELMIGSIAPDLGKLLGQTKDKGHFLEFDRYTSNLPLFLQKYDTSKPFEMGYYIHLFTDILWFRDFLPKYTTKNLIRLNDGKVLELCFKDRLEMIYRDYSSLNNFINSYYGLNLDFLKEPYVEIKSNITEIETNKINLLLKETNTIINASEEKELLVFKKEKIIEFINYSAKIILEEVENGKLNTCKQI